MKISDWIKDISLFLSLGSDKSNTSLSLVSPFLGFLFGRMRVPLFFVGVVQTFMFLFVRSRVIVPSLRYIPTRILARMRSSSFWLFVWLRSGFLLLSSSSSFNGTNRPGDCASRYWSFSSMSPSPSMSADIIRCIFYFI